MQRNNLLVLIPILFLGLVPFAFGQVDTQINKDNNITNFGNGTFQYSSHFPYLETEQGNFVPYRLSETSNVIQVEFDGGKIVFDKFTGGATVFKNGTSVIDSDSYVVRSAELNTDNWFHLAVNEASRSVTVSEVGDDYIVISVTRQNVEGIFTIDYKIRDTIKTTAKFTNLQYANNKFAFTETLNLDSNIIQFNNQTINLNDYVGQSFSREILEQNQDLILEAQDILYYSGIGFENLWSVGIFENNKVALDYANVNQTQTSIGETVELDPTITRSSNSHTGASGNCSAMQSGSISWGQQQDQIFRHFTGVCTAKKWTISTLTIPSGATINSGTVTIPNQCCGSIGVTIWVGSTVGNSAGQIVIYGSNPISLSNPSAFNGATEWFALPYATSGGTQNVSSVSGASVSITYTLPPPNSPTSLTATQTTANQVNLSWTAPSSGTSPTGYKVERSIDNSNWSVLTSNTGSTATTYNDTTVSAGTLYYYRVFSYDSGGSQYSTSSSNTASITTWNVPNQISDLSAQTGANPYLTWSAPSSDSAITGYKIYRDSNYHDITTNLYYTDSTNLTNGVSYDYQVSAVSAVGESSLSAVASATAGVPPDPPTGVSSSIPNPNASPLDVQVTYSSPANVGTGTLDGFKLYRNGTLVETVGLTNTISHTVSGAGTWSFTVTATSTHGESSASSASILTTPTVPDAPVLTVTGASSSSLNLSWSSPSSGGSAITGYKIERSADGVTFGTLIANTGSTGTTLTDSGLSIDTRYWYKVYAINNVGTSSASNTDDAYTLLDAPSSLSASASSDSQIGLSWSAPSSGTVLGYKIQYESPTGNGFSNLVADTGNTNTSYTATSLDSATQYNFRVYTISNGGTSASSSNESASTTIPLTPQITVATGTQTNTIRLTHTSNSTGSDITLLKVRYVDADDTDWTTVTASFANPYSLSGLNINTQYTMQISYGTSGGYSAFSANSTGSTTETNPNYSPSAGGGGGGGGGTAPTSSSSLIETDNLTSLSIVFNQLKMGLDETKTGIIKVTWDSTEDLQIQKIILGDSPFRFAFAKTPFILYGDESGFSDADVSYSVKAPDQFCSNDVTAQCIRPISYTVPVEITIIAKDTGTIVKNDVITINMGSTGDIDIALFAVIGLITVPVIGYVVKSKKHKSTAKKNGSIKESLNL